MKFEIENGEFIGTVEWQGPGSVALDMADPDQKTWFERYFTQEDSHMGGPVGEEHMSCERRDESEESFNRAAFQLAAYSYKVRQGDGRRHGAHRNGSGRR